MQGHQSPISGVACFEDRFVATAGYDNRVILWDARSRRSVARAFHDHLANQCAFSPDGKLLATASSDHTARLWRVPDLRLVAVLHQHTDDVEMVAFSPDGKRLATASRDACVRVFDAAGELLHTLRGHTADVISVQWCHGGRELVSSSDDGTVRVWSAADGSLVRTLDLGDVETDTLVVTPDGTVIAGNDEGELVVIRDGLIRRFAAHQAGVKRLAHDARTGQLVSLSYDRFVRVWSLAADATPTLVHETAAPPEVWLRSVAVDGAGRLVFGTFGSSFAVYDPETSRWDLSHVRDTPGVNAALHTREGVYTVGDAGVVRLNGRLFTRLPSLCNFLVAWEGRVYTGGQTGELFDARTGERIFSAGSPLNCGAVVTRKGSTALVVGTYVGEGIVFERVGAEVRFVAQMRLHPNAVKSLASDGDALFSVCANGDAAWHDAEALATIRVVERAHDKIANGAAALGDGVFVSVSRDLSLRIWRPDGTVERVRSPHTHSIKCVAVCPATRRVATASYDGRVAVWSVNEGRWIHHDRPTTAGISSITRGAMPGEFLASSYDGSVYRMGRDGRADVTVPASRDTTGWTHTYAPRRDGTRVPVLRDRISEVSL